MAIDRVREFFRNHGIEDRVMEFPVSSATVDLAATAVGCVPARIGKTLSFRQSGKCVLLVVAGDARIDNARYKARFGTKAKMLSPEEVLLEVGHAVGGVCPFGIMPGVDVYLDESLRRFDSVFPACGSDNSAIELTLPELERYAGSMGWVDVCKNWQETAL